ncbi:endonuclease/exonuclease/phosphatase family protein [Haloferula sargassicola]|uniref:endonuclease/exonuclease/phosphatase family protein n=1 Tax=Haloferula sargassicola TaxID=490096 RepID=UPI00336551D4
MNRVFTTLLGSLAPGIVAAAGPAFTVMSFNTWHDLSQVKNGFEKGREAIRRSGADIVCLQESTPQTSTRLAEELGWHRAENGTGSVEILSRFPVVETYAGKEPTPDRFIGARFLLGDEPRREVIVFNTHLDYVHYGPYAAARPQATPASTLAENRRSERVPQITAVLNAMKPYLTAADSLPVILTGDFNGPSHLDWTQAAAANHHGIGPVAWPESRLVIDRGMVDSFRHRHPDPVAMPGTTWSAIHKDSEPQDRIDFIYHKGTALRLVDSRVFTTEVETTIGAWGSDKTPVETNTWPSDHAAVVSSYCFDAASSTPGE